MNKLNLVLIAILTTGLITGLELGQQANATGSGLACSSSWGGVACTSSPNGVICALLSQTCPAGTFQFETFGALSQNSLVLSTPITTATGDGYTCTAASDYQSLLDAANNANPIGTGGAGIGGLDFYVAICHP